MTKKQRTRFHAFLWDPRICEKGRALIRKWIWDDLFDEERAEYTIRGIKRLYEIELNEKYKPYREVSCEESQSLASS